MAEQDIFTELAERLGAPTSERFMAILHEMFTPEEAAVCQELIIPGTIQDLKDTLGYDEATLTKMLDSLIDRGILTRGETLFAFHSSLLGFHHDIADTGVHSGPNALPQKVKDLWADFFYNEWSDIWTKSASDRKAAGGQGIMLTPAIGAIEISNISDDDLVPQENWKMQIKLAKKRIVAPCGCRVLWGKCDHPLMTCFAVFDNSRGEYYLNKPGRMLKEYTEEETLEIVSRNEEAGLVHWGVCYCCRDACEMLYSYTKNDRLDLVEPNRFQAAVDQETCVGCQDCVDKCPFNAVEMVKVPGSKKLKATIIAEKCKGCGVCVVGCKAKALKLEIVRPKSYMDTREFRFPAPKPSKGGRRIPVNAPIGPYGGFYELG
ncbi:MAG: 4Fe-4S dicluster domain-containing protein [Dehalococcoidales bacterium]|nr:4Fe-4S dicluster domain-containing protein [Dehalococcoidales bacterium]